MWEQLAGVGLTVSGVINETADYTGAILDAEAEIENSTPIVKLPGTCNYMGADPCYGICETPLMDAYDVCDNYCIELSELESASGTSAVRAAYNSCW